MLRSALFQLIEHSIALSVECFVFVEREYHELVGCHVGSMVVRVFLLFHVTYELTKWSRSSLLQSTSYMARQ